MRYRLNRRTVLRGLCQGAAIGVGLPVLDSMLNGNGTALASGAPMPLRFGTWFWGCGMNPSRWNPTVVGPGYDLPVELSPIADYREKISVLSGFNAILDQNPNHPHHSGVLSTLTGTAPAKPDQVDSPTLDILISDHVGTQSRFRSLEVSSSGNPRKSYSRRSTSLVNPAEVSPLALYTRLFGDGFVDPNAGEFKPDPMIAVRQSVLSAVKEDRQRLMRSVGSHDRERLDDYFTSVRQMEQQLEVMLQPPPPAESCSIPEMPSEDTASTEIEQAITNHKLMSQLLSMAIACDQTRVFNMLFSYGASGLRKAGTNVTHHQLTHEEPVNTDLGYQPEATFFVNRSMEAFRTFVATLDSIPEGDGTLLDNCIVFAHSETSFAKVHDVQGLPIMIAGSGGGRLRTGVHITGKGSPISRVGLTLQHAMGLPVASWGSGSMKTDKAVDELFV